MESTDRRTPEQIREEIRAERAQIETTLAALRAEAAKSGKVAGSALALLGTLALVLRLRAWRRAR